MWLPSTNVNVHVLFNIVNGTLLITTFICNMIVDFIDDLLTCVSLIAHKRLAFCKSFAKGGKLYIVGTYFPNGP